MRQTTNAEQETGNIGKNIFLHFALYEDFLWYTTGMKRETIFESNHYLRDPESYADQLVNSVASSTAIEIGRIKPSLKRALVSQAGRKKSTSSRAKSYSR